MDRWKRAKANKVQVIYNNVGRCVNNVHYALEVGRKLGADIIILTEIWKG